MASTVSSCGSAWTANHTYTSPVCVTDGTDHEWLMITGEAGATCVSGSSTPSWGTNIGQQTNDGTCHWDNGGTFTIVAEGSNYGDYILPVQTAFKAITQTEPRDPAPTATRDRHSN